MIPYGVTGDELEAAVERVAVVFEGRVELVFKSRSKLVVPVPPLPRSVEDAS